MHWRDVESAAQLSELQSTARRLLDTVRTYLSDRNLIDESYTRVLHDPSVVDAIGRVCISAGDVCSMEHTPSDAHDVVDFAKAVLRGRPRDTLIHAVLCDGKVLAHAGDNVARGEAFEASAVDRRPMEIDVGSASVAKPVRGMPEWISRRVSDTA